RGVDTLQGQPGSPDASSRRPCSKALRVRGPACASTVAAAAHASCVVTWNWDGMSYAAWLLDALASTPLLPLTLPEMNARPVAPAPYPSSVLVALPGLVPSV